MRIATPAAPTLLRSAWRWTALLVLAALVLLAGCRTYGRYDATEKMLPEMRQSVQLFASDLERARTSHDLLRQAAQGDSALGLVSQEYAAAVATHERVLENNRAVLDRYEEDLPDYRTMHRMFGAMLSEHQTTRNRYRSLTKAVRYPGATARLEAPRDAARRRALPDTALRVRDETFTEGRYYVTPLFYERLQSGGSAVTMRQALTERQQRQSQAGRLSAGTQQGGEAAAPLGPDAAN